MKTKLAALFVAFTLLLSITAYADIPKFHYSFEEALKMALKNTPEYKAMDKKISDAYDYFEFLDKKTPDDISYTGSMKVFVERQVDPHVGLETAYTNYQMAVLTRNNIKRSLQLGLRETVIGIEKAEMAAKEAKINEKTIKNQLKLLEIQYKEGLASKNDYNNKKRELTNNLKKLDDADKYVDTVYHNLNVLLGREDEKDIVIHLDETEIPIEKLDLKRIKTDIMNNSDGQVGDYSSLKTLKENRHISGYRYDLVKERYDKYDLDKFTDKMRDDIEEMYEEAKDEFEIADKKYNNALARFNKDFDDLLADIEDLYEDIKDIKEEISEEKNNQRIYKIKFDSGMISKIEYDNLKDNMIIIENKLRKKELDLNMKYAELLIYSDLKRVVLD
ncbi:MAG: TolC family protein [Firmicutes bacterium]|nr:TolC family protein [Bacillota bacterium]